MQSSDKAYPDSFPIASGAPNPVAGSIAHLLHLLDRPIAFHRCFVTLAGSITAALMLSQALYWQKRTKDHDGWWYKTRDEWTAETGMKRKEQEGARRKLRKLGLLHEQRRGVPAQLWYRVDEIRLLEMLAQPAAEAALEPVPDGLKQPVQLVQNGPSGKTKTYQQAGTKGTSKKALFGPTFKEQRLHRDYTETTTTTPNPSASNERTAEPEPARSGRGVQNQNPKSQDSDQELVTLATTEQNPVSQEEIQTVVTPEKHCETVSESQNLVASAEEVEAQQPELTYPAKLTEREREDIAAQIGTLPPKTAQQMLDVVEAKIGAGQIRTSAAAVLRGIVRKYRIDPDSFDPSSGFQIVAARRRRVENEWQIQRALEERNSVPLPSPLPPRQNGPRARPEGLKALLQVCHQRLHMPLPADCLNPA